MSIAYAGVPLVIPDPEIVGRIETAVKLGELYLQSSPDAPMLSDEWQIPEYVHDIPVKLGRLQWPVGATQWAIGRFLATEDQLNSIRAQAYVGGSQGLVSLPLVMDDGQSRITTNLFMRPPRPMHQWTDGQSLYLLELVDERFFWWWKPAAIIVAPGMLWSDLVSAIADNLPSSISITTPIDSKFLNPSHRLTCHYDYLPMLLDTIAYSLQRRIVRTLAGTVILQTADEAFAQSNILYGAWSDQVHFGGFYNFDVEDTPVDLPSQVPNSVTMRFPADSPTGGTDPDFWTVVQNLSDLGLPQYFGKVVASGTNLVHTHARAFMMGSTPINLQELKDLCKVWSTEWYKWQTADDAIVYSGTVPWDGDGSLDVVEWSGYLEEGTSTLAPDMRTWVSREPMNDMAIKTFHGNDGENSAYSGSGSGPVCIDSFGDVDFKDIPLFDPNGPTVYLFGEQGGCAVKVPTTMC